MSRSVHSQKRTTCSGLMKTGLNNILLPTLFNVVNNTVLKRVETTKRDWFRFMTNIEYACPPPPPEILEHWLGTWRP